MAVIVNGDGILTGISSLATALTDLTSGRGTITGVTTVGTLQLGAGVSMSSPRSQNAAIFTNNTEFLTVDDAGRVGVGTVTPNSDAHPQNVGKINVGFITARSIAGDIDARNLVVAGVSTFVDDVYFDGATAGRDIIFDRSNHHLKFKNNAKISLGDNDNANLYYDGTNPILYAGTHTLRIVADNIHLEAGDFGDEFLRCTHDGGVSLYFDNSQKFTTTSDGATFNGSALFPDNQRIKVGGDASSPDLQIYHDTNNTYMLNSTGNFILKDTTGNIYLQSTNVYIQDDTTNEDIAKFISDGACELYHNNSKKFETLTSGVEVQGSVISKNTGAGSGSSNLELQPYGTDAYINATASGNLYTRVGPSYPIRTQIDSSGNFIVQNGNIKLATSGKGIDFSVTAQSASPSSEILDDYEEGTWTFAIVPGGGSYQYNYGQTGYYSKIGNQVFINAWIHLIVSSTVSGGITLTGLPFPCQNRSRNWIPVGGYGHSSAINSAGLFLIATTNGTTGSFYYTNTAYGAGASLTAGNLGSSAELYINGTYLTDS